MKVHYCQEVIVHFSINGKQAMRYCHTDGNDGRTQYLKITADEQYIEIAYCDKDGDAVRCIMIPRENACYAECSGWVSRAGK